MPLISPCQYRVERPGAGAFYQWKHTSARRRAASANRADVSTDRRFIRNSAERGTYARREGGVAVTEAADGEVLKWLRVVLSGAIIVSQ
jgi:hypothetical protein